METKVVSVDSVTDYFYVAFFCLENLIIQMFMKIQVVKSSNINFYLGF